MKKVIYFLCTGNSCRSQIAEGYATSILGEFAEVHSAGIEAHGMNPRAVATMKADGINIEAQSSQTIDLNILNSSDYVITLCGHAKDVCPTIPASARHLHWGFDDPAKAIGTDKELEQQFARVRDQIKLKIIEFKSEISKVSQ